jgi:hypothetical protein
MIVCRRRRRIGCGCLMLIMRNEIILLNSDCRPEGILLDDFVRETIRSHITGPSLHEGKQSLLDGHSVTSVARIVPSRSVLFWTVIYILPGLLTCCSYDHLYVPMEGHVKRHVSEMISQRAALCLARSRSGISPRKRPGSKSISPLAGELETRLNGFR